MPRKSVIDKETRDQWFADEAAGVLTTEDLVARMKEAAPGEVDDQKITLWRAQWKRAQRVASGEARPRRKATDASAMSRPQKALVVTEELIGSILTTLDAVSSQVESVKRMLSA